MQISTSPAIEAIRNKIMADLAPLPDYATAIGKSERAVWGYVKQGLPVTYIGRTCFVVVSKATEYWAARSRQQNAPKRGRPRKHAIAS